MPDKITAWSPSRIRDHDQCPRKARYKHVERRKEPGNAATQRGDEIHKSIESYIKGIGKKLHPEVKGKRVKKLINELRQGYKDKRVRVELELAFNRKWEMVEWFSKEAYVRIKIDAVRLSTDGKTIELIDWKTGRLHTVEEKPEYREQLDLYSVGGLLAFPQAEAAMPSLVFVDHDETVTVDVANLVRKNLVLRQKWWDKRAKPIMTDTMFQTKPGKHCGYCFFSANKGGPCEY